MSTFLTLIGIFYVAVTIVQFSQYYCAYEDRDPGDHWYELLWDAARFGAWEFLRLWFTRDPRDCPATVRRRDRRNPEHAAIKACLEELDELYGNPGELAKLRRGELALELTRLRGEPRRIAAAAGDAVVVAQTITRQSEGD